MLQGWTLLLIGPFLDRYVSSSWVFDFSYSFNAVVFLVLSCSMAVFVNISQFMCLGRFSAVSFQVRPGVFTQIQTWLLLHFTVDSASAMQAVISHA